MTELPTRRERRLAEVSRARAAAAEPATVAIDLRAPQPVPEVVTGRRRDRGGPAEERTRVLGILNVTPDSFSDGGLHQAYDAAVQHARDLVAAGADVIDVGGESTRPGSERVPVPVEQRLESALVEAAAAAGFRAEHHRLDLVGRCSDCLPR